MSYYIKISNNGVIDTNGFHLMGVSTKRGEDKIGFFGSGNKYAIALLLRKKIDFKIFAGLKEVLIDTEPVIFRGQLFNQIKIDGEKTSLTTEMGPDWETWFAVREIYCNAQDEDGAKIEVSDSLTPEDGKTIVYIELNDELSKLFKNINNYILTNYESIETVKTYYGQVEILNAATSDEFICYRKGIRIYPENTVKSLYYYNFDRIEINESRTYKYDHQIREQIASALACSVDRKIILNYLNNWKENFERNLHWGHGYCQDNLSQEWHNLLSGKRIYPDNIAEISGDFEGKFNSFIVPNELAEKISKEILDCEVVGYKKESDYKIVKPTDSQKKLVDSCVEQLAKIGYQIKSKIEYIEPDLNDVVASYDRASDTIFLSTRFLSKASFIKNTLLEEHFHSLGLDDGNRFFVTFLIDEIIKSKESNEVS